MDRGAWWATVHGVTNEVTSDAASTDIILPTKAVAFPIVLYECELHHKEGSVVKN